MNRLLKMTVVAALVTSASALAGPLSLWVGQRQTLMIFQKISKVRVSNPALVKVTTVPKLGVDLKAMGTGRSTVKISCRDGSEYTFQVHVINDGEVYSTNRSEPEHYQWTLSSTQSKPTHRRAALELKSKKPVSRPA